jgi:hypothetical protein
LRRWDRFSKQSRFPTLLAWSQKYNRWLKQCGIFSTFFFIYYFHSFLYSLLAAFMDICIDCSAAYSFMFFVPAETQLRQTEEIRLTVAGVRPALAGPCAILPFEKIVPLADVTPEPYRMA